MIGRWKKIALRMLIVVFLVTACHVSTAHALDPDEIGDKSDEKLREEGWQTIEGEYTQGSLSCGLWAIAVSTVWRGWGHRCSRDDSSHYVLLTMEGISLGLIATALTISSLTRDDDSVSPVWKSMLHIGTSLFVASYVFDLVGTFKGSLRPFSENTRFRDGFGLSFKFHWLPSTTLDIGLVLGINYRHPRFWVNADAEVSLREEIPWQAGIDTGAVLWRGENRGTHFDLGIISRFSDMRPDSYQMLTVIPYVAFSLDLGSLMPHLRHVQFINRLGVGTDLLRIKGISDDGFHHETTILLLESEFNLNIFENLNFAMIYRHRPDQRIGPFQSPYRLFNTIPVDGIGIFSFAFDFRLTPRWFTNLEVNIGSSIDFWLSITTQF